MYLVHGARSSKKVDMLHLYIKEKIESALSEHHEYIVKLEEEILSCNTSGHKKCDIVLFKNGDPIAIFPVKMIMSNYYQNKNNGWEGLTGECLHIKWANPELKIIPFNIIFSVIPYLDKSNVIKKFEIISYEKSFQIMEKLKEHHLADDMMNFIIDVSQVSQIGESYHQTPIFEGFNHKTPFRSIQNMMMDLLEKV